MRLANAHPQTRAQVCEALLAQLWQFGENSRDLNAILISMLIETGREAARRSTPLLREVFEAGRANEDIAGDWESIQGELS